MKKFPNEQALHDLLTKHGIGPALWEEKGPRNTTIRRITCYRWAAAKTVCIVQEFGPRIRQGQPWQDIDGWELFAPVSNRGAIVEVDAAMTEYERAQRAPQSASAGLTEANNG